MAFFATVSLAFTAGSDVLLVNKTNTRLNELLFSRLFLQKLKQEVLNKQVSVTLVSFSSLTSEDHLRNGKLDNEFKTLKVEYFCDLILKVGDKTQKIRKKEVWQAPLGAIAVSAPADEQLIVDLISKQLKNKTGKITAF